MANFITGFLKHAPKLFSGAKCDVLKFTLVIDEAAGKKIPVVVFGKKASTYSELLTPGDQLKVCGQYKQHTYGDETNTEMHLGDYGAGYVKRIGRQPVPEREQEESEYDPSINQISGVLPDNCFPDPTDNDLDNDTAEWSQPFPGPGFSL